jgi:hypothetical protein
MEIAVSTSSGLKSYDLRHAPASNIRPNRAEISSKILVWHFPLFENLRGNHLEYKICVAAIFSRFLEGRKFRTPGATLLWRSSVRRLAFLFAIDRWLPYILVSERPKG